MNFKIKPFKSIWKKLKKNLNDLDLELFYEVVGIDGQGGPGRRIYPGCGREDNPRFYNHWFAHGRCHWNVILPCFILNNGDMIGSYKIITNDKHSAIINVLTNEILDPLSLDQDENTLDRFKDDYKIIDLIEHAVTVSPEISEKILEFINNHYDETKVNEFIKKVTLYVTKK